MNQTPSPSKERYHFPDFLRGMAIVLMFIFHFTYDLNHLDLMEIDMRGNPFWFTLPRIIVFLFLFSMGLSMPITHSKGIKWKKFSIRLLKIVFSALGVSLVTYLLFPSRWIYFGTLHCISICTLAALPFIHRPLSALIFGLLIPIPFLLGHPVPWITLPHISMDYIPPFPWFAAVLLGIYCHSLGLHRAKIPTFRITEVAAKITRKLGQHSLMIYLIHQPILYGITLILKKLLSF